MPELGVASGFVAGQAPRTVQDATLAQLRSWIAQGRLRPGERLHQDQLAHALGVSRMPVREAIRQLAAEGLVVQRPHRGAFVASFNPAEIRELYLIRAALECLAAGLAVERITPAEIEQLEAQVAEMRAAAAAGDDEATLDLDLRFHKAVYAATGAPMLVSLIDQLRERSWIFRRAHAHIPGRAPVSAEEHASLVRALTARDRAAVERLSREHLDNAAEHLIAYVAQ